MSDNLIDKCFADFAAANFRCDKEFIRRFVAALLAKRFVVLTGLAGSGKTKLAQCFARWISPRDVFSSDPFTPGAKIPSDRITYMVRGADRLAVEFWNDPDETKATKVVLPRALIQEWVNEIQAKHFTEDATAREIREAVATTTKFSTQLNSFETHLKAAAFAVASAPQQKTAARCYEVVSVGADWTNSEHVLGYADGLDKSHYVRTRALDLVLRAIARPELPHFLILDEMNLSHVERYFADFLSAIESGETLNLHSDKDVNGAPAVRDGVPGEIRLPRNLFIIGTVNVDETTYMFSPKVLDRANVLEFRVSATELRQFLGNPAGVDFTKLDGAGARFGSQLLSRANEIQQLPATERRQFENELVLFFDALQSANAEFGFRVAGEGASFLHQFRTLTSGAWEFRSGMDALILQKLLPKLHGSRNTLEPVLWTLATLCFAKRDWQVDEATQQFVHTKSLVADAAKARRMEDESLDPLGMKPDGAPNFPPSDAYYPLSFDKTVRMLARLRMNGFTSFAEA